LSRVRLALALLALGTAGAAAPFAIPAIGASSSKSTTVTIKVTASEWKFVLSRKSLAKPATVIFKVTNKGKIAHDFKINGKKTQLIKPGATKSVKVVFTKKGRFGFLCTVNGHARLGMKGTFTVAVKASTTTSVTTTTGSTTTTTGSTTTTPTTCTTPTATVNVGMREYVFELDKTSVPAGCIQFVIKNNGGDTHNFDLQGRHNGALLSPAGTETWNVQLAAGSYSYVCDVGQHQAFGMFGTFMVT
jgi:uncharacterized cupredoxin-like copper-binding protein